MTERLWTEVMLATGMGCFVASIVVLLVMRWMKGLSEEARDRLLTASRVAEALMVTVFVGAMVWWIHTGMTCRGVLP